MQPLTLSLIQTQTHWHDPAANMAMFDRWFTELPESADIVVLPEMFSTGFTMNSTDVAQPMNGPTVEWLKAAAVTLNKVVCGSVVIKEDGLHYNRFLWATPCGELGIYDKRHRFRMAGEHDHYDAGNERLVLTVGGWKICPMICYDLRFPVWFRNRDDYDVLLCVANWPAARLEAWSTLLRARAIENLSYALGVNIIGEDGNSVTYRGGTVAYNPEGEVLIQADDQAGIFTVELDRAYLDRYRAAFPAWQDADDYRLVDEREPTDR